MKPILTKILGRIASLSDVQPLLTLFLAGALLAVFLTALSRMRGKNDGHPPASLLWRLYAQAGVLISALALVGSLAGGLSLLRSYLRQTVANFEHNHGRITTANYNAVQTIWGAEQEQGELAPELYYEEEVTERIESEDLTKPAVLRKKIVRHNITANPFLSARHEITLKQNARKKGSALYGGYETVCRFSWRLKNPTDRALSANIKFPLPASRAMYDSLFATLNGQDVLPKMQLKDATLILPRELQPGEAFDLSLGFTSRGMTSWYLQVREAREIRDFVMTLTLPDLPKARLNYPEGCMTPTETKPTTNGLGSVLTFRLDHAISNKGMGIALPSLPQPGAATSAVLDETEQSLMLIFALLVLGLTLGSVRHAVLLSLLFASGTALAYGVLADFSDLLFGFWGTAAIILLPLFCLLAWFLTRILPGLPGRLLALQFLVFSVLLPCLAGLDHDRELLYLNLCAILFLASAAWHLAKHWEPEPAPQLREAL